MHAHPLAQGALRGALALALAAGAAGAQAQLFPDNEARRAIVDLRAQVTADNDQTKARLAELTATNQRLLEQVQQLQRSLLEMNNQVESLRTELAKQRGIDEQMARDVAELQRRQKDVSQGIDERLRRFEPTKVTVDGKEFQADPEEKRLYEEAIATLRSGDFNAASASLTAFLRRYPSSGYAESARYWLGNALYGKREYRDAIGSFRAFLATAPDHPRAPEALLAVANCQVEMKDVRGARATLGDLLKTYPQSEAAQAGRERLAALK